MNKGDRVSIYMPMVVELVVAMLACARIGAVHSIVVSLDESVQSITSCSRQHSGMLTAVSMCVLSVCRVLG